MDPAHFFSSSRVVVVVGKGGVGSSTVTATYARAAAAVGRSVLVVDVEGRTSLDGLLGGGPFGYEPVDVPPSPEPVPGGDGEAAPVRVCVVDADEALGEYLRARGLHRIARRLLDGGLGDVIGRGVPGIGDLLVLGKIRQLEQAGAADVIVVDAPSSGHAVSFLRAAAGLGDAVRFGPIAEQATAVAAMLADPARTQVLLVTLAEDTPVSEVVEVAFVLEDDVGVALGPVVVNACETLPAAHPTTDGPGDAATPVDGGLLDAIRAATAFDDGRRRREAEQLDRLGELLPLPRLPLGRRPGVALGPSDVAALAGELLAGVRALPEGTGRTDTSEVTP